ARRRTLHGALHAAKAGEHLVEEKPRPRRAAYEGGPDARRGRRGVRARKEERTTRARLFDPRRGFAARRPPRRARAERGGPRRVRSAFSRTKEGLDALGRVGQRRSDAKETRARRAAADPRGTKIGRNRRAGGAPGSRFQGEDPRTLAQGFERGAVLAFFV